MQNFIIIENFLLKTSEGLNGTTLGTILKYY